MARKCPSCATEYADDVFFCGQDGTITVQVQDPADFDPRLGQQLGGYIVVARVADGAMGRVFEGRHPETKARVAVKVLHADVAKDDVSVERFRREYETAKEFHHHNIVSVLEFGETPDGSWYLTMEYLEGEELGQLLRRDGPVPMPRVVRIFSQISLALDHAHSFGVIHRDLKPDNIFLCRSAAGDDTRILDFGSVKLQMETGPKLTAFGTTLGSPYYMSPEQAMGKSDVDQRTDVFAATAILYEMLTGKIAFEGSSIAEILMKIVNGSPTVASSFGDHVPPQVDAVFNKGFQKDKKQRFETAGELAKAFLETLGLAPDPAKWAAASNDEIVNALRTSSPKSLNPPPAPKPAAPAATAAPVKAAASAAKTGGMAKAEPRATKSFPNTPASHPTGDYELPTSSSKKTVVIAAVVFGVVLIGVLFMMMRS